MYSRLKVCVTTVVAALALLFIPDSLQALDIGLRVIPSVLLPLEANFDEESASDFTVGAGATAVADTEFLTFLTPSAEIGFSISPRTNSSNMLTLTTGGLGLGFNWYPISRLKLSLGAIGGVFIGRFAGDTGLDSFWRVRAEAGYRFTPTFSIQASGGYAAYQNTETPGENLFTAMDIGVAVNLGVTLGKERGRGLGVKVEQTSPLFPIRTSLYSKESFGSIQVTNNEATEISDLEVSFSVDGISSGPLLCGKSGLVRKKKSVEVPLYAALGERSLEFTESSVAQGTVTVSYKLLDERIVKTWPASVSFNHRNAMTWENPHLAAAYISPNDGLVLDLSKYAVGLVRENLRPDLDNNLQFGMAIFESMRLLGLTWTPDPTASYTDCRSDSTREDYVQYPYQTFSYRGGDTDDLSILLSAAFESVGLSSALIPLKGGMLVAFALEMPESRARRFFSDSEAFIWNEEKAWVVLDVEKLREGFLAAWKSGAGKWGDALVAGEDGSFFTVASAWKEFPPVGVTVKDQRISKPREELVSRAFEASMTAFVALEIEPKVKAMREEFGAAGPSAKQLNSLGILYARYGLLAEAREWFSKAALKGSDSASMNLANTVFLLKDWATAAKLYRTVVSRDGGNKAAKLGLSRALYEIDQYTESSKYFEELCAEDPSYAAKYAYLSAPKVASLKGKSSDGALKGVSWPQE